MATLVPLLRLHRTTIRVYIFYVYILFIHRLGTYRYTRLRLHICNSRRGDRFVLHSRVSRRANLFHDRRFSRVEIAGKKSSLMRAAAPDGRDRTRLRERRACKGTRTQVPSLFARHTLYVGRNSSRNFFPGTKCAEKVPPATPTRIYPPPIIVNTVCGCNSTGRTYPTPVIVTRVARLSKGGHTREGMKLRLANHGCANSRRPFDRNFLRRNAARFFPHTFA